MIIKGRIIDTNGREKWIQFPVSEEEFGRNLQFTSWSCDHFDVEKLFTEKEYIEDVNEVAEEIANYESSIGYVMDHDDYSLKPMDEFDDEMRSYTPLSLADMIYEGKFNPNDQYYGYNGFGKLVSYSPDEAEEVAREVLLDIMQITLGRWEKMSCYITNTD